MTSAHIVKALPPKALIVGCSGLELNAAELAFFQRQQPFGLILFQRNCVNPDQIRHLVDSFRAAVGRPDAPVLIDQEGGRVARLHPPEWPAHPSAHTFGRLAEASIEAALEASFLNGYLIARDLAAVGINVNCAPVLDLLLPEGHDVIGDRAFHSEPHVIAALGQAMADGLFAGGVQPIIKHLPGHGRARADSHHELPVVETDLFTLIETDFKPFKSLCEMPWAMLAHITYTALDSQPVTISPKAMGYIREQIGFAGILLSDDISMKALRAPIPESAAGFFAAGGDVLLHCNGHMDEMEALVSVCPAVNDTAWQVWLKASAKQKLAPAKNSLDYNEVLERRDFLLQSVPNHLQLDSLLADLDGKTGT